MLTAAAFAGAQTRKGRPAVKPPAPKTQPAATPEPAEPQPTAPAKKNGRPGGDPGAVAVKEQPAGPARTTAYIYEFSRPGFTVPHITIRHDDTGRGTIEFKKQGLDETISDPVTLSPLTLERINAALAALAFLDSTTDYQFAKDYSHLGNVAFTFQKDGRSRTAKFNWTDNKDARALSDEYRKLGNQYVWQFDIAIARENQPLEAPQMMDVLDGYLKRGEISDPKQMLPLLKELSNDERIPLIARNHASKIVERVEKSK